MHLLRSPSASIFVCLLAVAATAASPAFDKEEIADVPLAEILTSDVASSGASAVAILEGVGTAVDVGKRIYDIVKPLNKEHVISVTNKCGPRGKLRVQCASKDDTIRPKPLQNNDAMAFKFKQNLIRSTHFWCDVWWNGKHQVFPAFGKGAPKHGHNDFQIRENGIYFGYKLFRNWR